MFWGAPCFPKTLSTLLKRVLASCVACSSRDHHDQFICICTKADNYNHIHVNWSFGPCVDHTSDWPYREDDLAHSCLNRQITVTSVNIC